MPDGTFLQRLRPTGAGFLNDGWLTNSYANIDDNISSPTVSGTGDYIECTENNNDDGDWEGYAITNPTPAYWWYRIAKIQLHFLYYSNTTSFKSNGRPRFNVSWVTSGTRKGWSPASGLTDGKPAVSVSSGSWTWGSLSFYSRESSKPLDGLGNWDWIDWNRKVVNDIQIEVKAPMFADDGHYFRIAVFYADLYVWSTTHGGA